MVPPDLEFARLMEQVRSGCPEAARRVFERYATKISMVVRRRLPQQLRNLYDTLDFTQDVWASFFHIPADRYTFANPEELIAFLTRLADYKVVETVRRRLRTARNGCPLPLDDVGSTTDTAPVAHVDTPSQQVMAQECWQKLVHDLLPRHKEILERLALGHTHQEVADQLGTHTKEIQRLLRRLEEARKLP
jgi:DNA-directed RNA polymerase specialized sigma24 family protein